MEQRSASTLEESGQDPLKGLQSRRGRKRLEEAWTQPGVGRLFRAHWTWLCGKVPPPAPPRTRTTHSKVWGAVRLHGVSQKPEQVLLEGGSQSSQGRWQRFKHGAGLKDMVRKASAGAGDSVARAGGQQGEVREENGHREAASFQPVHLGG